MSITQQIVGLNSSHSFTNEEFVKIANLSVESLVAILAKNTDLKLEVQKSQYSNNVLTEIHEQETGIRIYFSTVNEHSVFYHTGKAIAIQVNVERSWRNKTYKRITPKHYDRIDSVVKDIAKIFEQMVWSEKQDRLNKKQNKETMQSFIGSLGYSTEGVSEDYASLAVPNTKYGKFTIKKSYSDYNVTCYNITEEQVRRIAKVLGEQ